MSGLGAKLFYLFVLLSCSVFGLAGAAAAASAPAWQSRWDKALNEAKKEGKVVVFGPLGDIIRQAITEDFKKAFPGIDIEYSGGRGGELATKIKSERDAGIHNVDIFLTGTTTAIGFLPREALAPIPSRLILPEVTDLKHWREGQLEFSDKAAQYNLIFANHLSPLIVYNPTQVKVGEIDTLYKLLDPKWKNKIVINDPLPSGAGHVHFRWLWDLLGPEKAIEYYRRLRNQAGAVDRDQRRQIEWVAQGKYAMLVAPSGGTLAQLIQRGLKVGVLGEHTDVGGWTTASFGSLVLLEKAPHPNAATVFANWILTKDAQTAWGRAMFHMSRRVDVPADHLPTFILPKAGGKYWSKNPKPNDKYWLSDVEENLVRSPEEEKILNELFGR